MSGQALGGSCAALCSVNLWMCGDARDRLSSTLHFDGHNNMLVCISGSKTVVLYPPDHRQCLAALHPVFAPSANHCRWTQDTRGGGGGGGGGGDAHSVVLFAGDCLFIPEGWFHQVTSEPKTIAVNLWWGGAGFAAVGVGHGLGTGSYFFAE